MLVWCLAYLLVPPTIQITFTLSVCLGVGVGDGNGDDFLFTISNTVIVGFDIIGLSGSQ